MLCEYSNWLASRTGWGWQQRRGSRLHLWLRELVPDEGGQSLWGLRVAEVLWIPVAVVVHVKPLGLGIVGGSLIRAGSILRAVLICRLSLQQGTISCELPGLLSAGFLRSCSSCRGAVRFRTAQSQRLPACIVQGHGLQREAARSIQKQPILHADRLHRCTCSSALCTLQHTSAWALTGTAHPSLAAQAPAAGQTDLQRVRHMEGWGSPQHQHQHQSGPL